MRYLSFDVELLNRIEFQGPSSLLGDWLKLSSYCAKQENGGKLRHFVTWKPSFYRHVGLRKSSMQKLIAAGLVSDASGEIVINFYPNSMETRVQNLRNNMAKARKVRAENRGNQLND